MRGLHHPAASADPPGPLADVRRAGARRSSSSTAGAGRTSSPAGPAGMCGAVRREVALPPHRATAPSVTWPAPPLRPPRPVPQKCTRCGSAALARHGRPPSVWSTSWRSPWAGGGLPHPGRLGTSPTSRGPCERAAAALAESGRARTGSPWGPKLAGAKGHAFRRHPGGRAGRGSDAALPRLPRRGATFGLVTQLAGRAGRAGRRSLAQTLAPEARAIQFAARHDADGFLAEELERRRALRYPPFGSLIRIVCAAEDPAMRWPSPRRWRAARRRRSSGAGRPRCSRLRGKARARSWSRPRTAGRSIGAVGRAVDAWPGPPCAAA